jgi:D-aspartate ligase
MTLTSTPVLLADATWYGTLAAVRDLGSRGIPVTVAYDEWTAPARWSRHARSVVRCPSTKDAEPFMDWLHDFGARNPGCVLYPTSDEVAFFVSAYQDSLARSFRIFTPALESLLDLLDKNRLAAAARRAGLAYPATWCPPDEPALLALVGELPLPVLIKPRTQVLSRLPGKVIRVDAREDIVAAWRRVRSANFEQRSIPGADGIDVPIIQHHHSVSERIYTVDGFVGPSGEIVGAAACVKCLQLPRRSGPGVCFESAELDPMVLAGLQRLCIDTGYVGVFDAEFVIDGQDKLLIDFNPRFYNHMAFEIDRHLPLPWLAYLAALGDRDAFSRAVASLGAVGAVGALGGLGGLGARADRDRVYAHRFPTGVMLAAQGLTRHMSRSELRQCRGLMSRSRAVTDPAYVRDDPLPACADVVQWLRHPRSFLRKAAAG